MQQGNGKRNPVFAKLVGEQRPRIMAAPPFRSTVGPEACELARSRHFSRRTGVSETGSPVLPPVKFVKERRFDANNKHAGVSAYTDPYWSVSGSDSNG
jgi:hypothetical protein